jgi:hypothetical protein
MSGRCAQSRLPEGLGDLPARPAHARGRDLRMLAELLGDPLSAALRAEPAHCRRDSLPHLHGAGAHRIAAPRCDRIGPIRDLI